MSRRRSWLFGFLLLTACELKDPYPLSEERVMKIEKSLPGEIYETAGYPWGPYKAGPSAVGNVNTAGHFQAVTGLGPRVRVTWPAVPGHYFEVHSYLTIDGECFYVTRKVPAEPGKSGR